ncbi:glycosyltransferase [Micromonospora sp. NPDC018662]|uniref:glycosyltransferase n=1 Tax=Micromonospora sp. NPDC018662 TaxID=3364238 RepID=UPI00379BC806
MLRVLQVIGPHVEVPPKAYGGSERVVESLAVHLPSVGVEVTTFTVGSSRVPGATAAHFPEPPARVDRNGDRFWDRTDDLIQVGKAFELAAGVDVVHLHTEYGLPFAALSPVPVVSTLHSYAGEGGGLERLVDSFPQVPYVAISERQRGLCRHLNVVATIPNCIPQDVLDTSPHDRPGGDPYLLFLGAIDERKGPDRAVEVARALDRRILLAGPVSRSNRAWFDRRIAPHVDGRRVDYLGDVGGADKRRLLSGAAALLSPVRWQEPFGLVAVEAMAAGTPVVATREGALAEIVEDGITGFTVRDPADLTEAARRAMTIDRRRCAAHARARFDPVRMARAYAEVYRRARADVDRAGG